MEPSLLGSIKSRIIRHKYAFTVVLCLLIVFILIISSGIFGPGGYSSLPEPNSTFDSTYALFPPFFLDYEYNGTRISLEELHQRTSSVSLSLVPDRFDKNVYCMFFESETHELGYAEVEYVIIYSPVPLAHLKRETLFSKGCIIMHINNATNILNYTGPYTEEKILEKMQNLSELVQPDVGPYRIGTSDEYFAYAYDGTWPWGAWQITMMLYDGTWIWITACLPIEWKYAIRDNLEIIPKSVM